MASRLDLQQKLTSILGSTNVYYQPPESVKMMYPAIVYSKKKPDINRANNLIYSKTNCYEVIVISKTPDHPSIELIENLEMASWERRYVSDNLYHDVITLYF